MANTFCTLTLKYLGIDTYKNPVIYMRKDCSICKSEGFESQTRVKVTLQDRSIIATLNMVESNLLHHNEASLSTYAWELLTAKEGDVISITHPKQLDSLSYIRSKVYGHELKTEETKNIIEDLLSGQLSDINIAMFIASIAGDRLTKKEVFDLTKAMIDTGESLSWPSKLVVDKHCVGGLPGNRTTPIVVAIVAAFGLIIPKTSSRAITSPAGTADVMEVFAPVNLNTAAMRRVVEQENGCIVWGGAVSLSPADDLLIRIERSLDLDSEGQMVASILSKKIAAGSTHVLIDLPIGTTAKIRSIARAEYIKMYIESVAEKFNLHTKIIFTDGAQPVGNGIGPSLEARDILAVLNCDNRAPKFLRERALIIAGEVIEFSPTVSAGEGKIIATDILNSKKALSKFQAICKAQGAVVMRDIPIARFTYTVESKKSGVVVDINNRYISRLAKLAGAPLSKAAGVDLFTHIGTVIQTSQPLFTIHAQTKGELNYAIDFLNQGHEIFQIDDDAT